jgi:hypothetical protein
MIRIRRLLFIIHHSSFSRAFELPSHAAFLPAVLPFHLSRTSQRARKVARPTVVIPRLRVRRVTRAKTTSHLSALLPIALHREMRTVPTGREFPPSLVDGAVASRVFDKPPKFHLLDRLDSLWSPDISVRHAEYTQTPGSAGVLARKVGQTFLSATRLPKVLFAPTGSLRIFDRQKCLSYKSTGRTVFINQRPTSV